MKQKPWPIIILAIFHVLAPVGNAVLTSVINSMGFLEFLNSLFHLENLQDGLNTLILPILAGYLVWACKKWSYFLYLSIMIYLTASTSYFWFQTAGFGSVWPVVVIFTSNIAIVSYFFIPAVRALYFDPRLRWWESSPRFHFSQPCHCKLNEQSLPATISNISLSGAFVFANPPPPDGANLILAFNVNGKPIEIHGVAIIHNKVDEMGFAVKFQHTPETSTQLTPLLDQLKREGRWMENRRPSAEDSVQFWAKKVAKLQGGLIPEIKNRAH